MGVSSRLQDAMEVLFDVDKPYFAAWLKLHDIDPVLIPGALFFLFCPFRKSDAAPLYYAALCGFYDLAEHLIAKYPQQVIAHGGYHVVPLVAALAGEHFGIAELLFRDGADATMNVRGYERQTPLHSAAYYGYVEVVRFLLEHNADANSRNSEGCTPLHCPPIGGGARCDDPNVPRQLADVARLLLQHGADVNAQSDDDSTPLHLAASSGTLEVARVLLEHGATVIKEDNEGRTPFQVALGRGNDEIMRLLSEHGARSV